MATLIPKDLIGSLLDSKPRGLVSLFLAESRRDMALNFLYKIHVFFERFYISPDENGIIVKLTNFGLH